MTNESTEHTATDSVYLAAHIQSALATDERTHMLDVRLEVHGNSVFLSGNVSCVERRQLAEQVARELVPEGTKIVNGLCVESYNEPAAPEPLN